MKTVFVHDLLANPAGVEVGLYAWVTNRRTSKGVIFLDLSDSTGRIQAVVDKKEIDMAGYALAETVPVESAVHVRGKIVSRPGRTSDVYVHEVQVISRDELRLSPQPRKNFNIFDDRLTDHVLRNRHLYIRNPKLMAILRFRSALMSYVRQWFEANHFLEIDAPVLTAVPLYDDGSAISLEINEGETTYVTVTFSVDSRALFFKKFYCFYA
ncbi:MAG: OB-fold nucleic acid binding domain-containing protein [Candidatus Moraniibacteriota bacterium]